MKALYLTYDGLTDPLGQSQILPYIIGLSSEGHSFVVVSFEKPVRFAANRKVIQELCDNNNIIWCPLNYTKRPPILATVFDVWKLNRTVAKLHSTNSFDFIHCRSYITAIIGLKMKRKFGVRFIFDMRGFWADERVDGGLWNLDNPFFKIVYSFFKRKETAFLIESDAIISLTEIGKKELLKWNIPELNPDKITVIPCVADFELFEVQTTESKIKAKEFLNIPSDRFVLSYLGSLGTWYLLNEMLEFFSLLKEKSPDAAFLFLTPDSPELILTAGLKYELDPTDFIIKYSPRTEIPAYMHASDYSIFFIKQSYSKLSSSPTKMAELMAMGIPIICNSRIGDIGDIMQKTKAGYCVDDFSDSEYNRIIKSLFSDSFSSSRIRKSAEQFFLLSKGVDRYVSIYSVL